jgi:two-component system, LytTR family, response regulator
MPTDDIRLLVADDEPLARKLLRQYVATCEGVEIVRECNDTTALEDSLRRDVIDAAVLDIRMPGRDVFGVLAEAASERPLPALIFATAYDRYALRAFEVNAVDYLLKPFTEERFESAIARLRDRRQSGLQAEGISRVLRDLGRHPDRLLVPDGQRMVPIAVSAITWIRAEGDYSRLHVGPASYLVYRTLTELEARLDPSAFLRVHRSAIVRLDQIVEVQPAGSSRYRVTLTDGTALIVSRTRAWALRKMIL